MAKKAVKVDQVKQAALTMAGLAFGAWVRTEGKAEIDDLLKTAKAAFKERVDRFRSRQERTSGKPTATKPKGKRGGRKTKESVEDATVEAGA